MEFGWTAEQRTYRDVLVRFAQSELCLDTIDRDAAGIFPLEAWRACADLGILGLPVPAEYGGAGADTLTLILAMEALGYGCNDNGLLFSLNAHMWACQHPITRFGTDEQKRRYLPGLADGSVIGAHAMTEPGSGSDAFSLATTAESRGSDFVLNGSKTFVTNGPVADLILVFATRDPAEGFAGLCAFLIDRGTSGLTVGKPLSKMGLRTSPMSEVFLDDCVVSQDQLLGKPGGGMPIFANAMERERSLILASSVGSMERQLERSIEHARTRHQFGRPIGSNQAVSHRLVAMKLRLETSRLLLYRLGWLTDEGLPTAIDSALVKLQLSEAFLASSLDALQTHGGYGYMTEYELEREVRDAVAGRLYSGTSDIQRNLVARYLGL